MTENANGVPARDGAATNGAARYQHDKVRVAIIGVGNCANSFVQGVHHYADADPAEQVPGLMHVDLGGYHVSDIEFTCAFDINKTKVGKDLGQAIWADPNNTCKFTNKVPKKLGVAGAPRHDPRRPRQVPQGEDHQGAGRDRRHRLDPQGDQDRRRRLLPAGRLRGRDQVVRRADPRGRRRLRELHPGVHRPRALLEQPLQEGGAADRRRRHQVAGRRHDRAPHAGAPVPRPRREDAAHLAAQRRRQHGLLQHARARAAGVQEDLQDQRGDVDHGPHAARRRRLHRPVGLRAVADRPQVGPHPPRGPGVRRRAAQHRAQARGLGLAELGRHRHRRRALLQARAQPRRRRPARRPQLVPDEVAAQPAPRRRGARGDREVHRQARRQGAARAPSPRAAPAPARPPPRPDPRRTGGPAAPRRAYHARRALADHRAGLSLPVGDRPRGQPSDRAHVARARPARTPRRDRRAVAVGRHRPRDAAGAARRARAAPAPLARRRPLASSRSARRCPGSPRRAARPFRSTSAARSSSSSPSAASTSATSTSRGCRASRAPRCAPRPRSTSAPSTPRPSARSRRRSRGGSSSSSSAASTRASPASRPPPR